MLCAISPNLVTLVIARLVQGLAGAVGIVIAQAAGRDVYEGGALIRYFGRLTVLGGLAAIVGPVLEGNSPASPTGAAPSSSSPCSECCCWWPP
ncbi:hypothetical protein SVIOM74S_09545 [Streptomyces violarus]